MLKGGVRKGQCCEGGAKEGQGEGCIARRDEEREAKEEALLQRRGQCCEGGSAEEEVVAKEGAALQREWAGNMQGPCLFPVDFDIGGSGPALSC